MNPTRLAITTGGVTYHGTARYRGAVPPTKGEWIGVEWDDETRGKHDGVYAPTGLRYFSCNVAGAGSFIRPTTPGISFGISFATALRLKYTPELTSNLNPSTTDTHSEFYSTSSNFSIEFISSAKVESNTRRLGGLREVGLAGEGVSHAGNEVELAAIALELKTLHTLDLSNSIIADLSEVSRLCARLPTLRTLLLNSNRFVVGSDITTGLSNLTTLHLNKSSIRWSDVVSISSSLVNLEDLQIGHNGIRNLSGESLNLPKLRTLNLEENLLESWIEVASIIKHLPSLSNLILNSNLIRTVSSRTEVIGDGYSTLERLEISNNRLDGWDSVDALDQYGLTSLWIDGNPFESDLSEEKLRAIIVARVGSLTQLQGSSISLAERNDSETFYLSMIAKGDGAATRVGTTHPRLAELTQKHVSSTSFVETIPKSAPITSATIASKLIRLTVDLPPLLVASASTSSLVLSVLPTLATRLLRTKIAKAVGKSATELSRSKWRLVGYLSTTVDAEMGIETGSGLRGDREELRLDIPINEEGRELSWWGLLDGDRVEIVPL